MLSGVHVARITTSISSGCNPAVAIALSPATDAISELLTCENLLSLIPVRCWIHSSDVSMNVAMSSFVTTLSGTHLPQPVIVDFKISPNYLLKDSSELITLISLLDIDFLTIPAVTLPGPICVHSSGLISDSILSIWS